MDTRSCQFRTPCLCSGSQLPVRQRTLLDGVRDVAESRSLEALHLTALLTTATRSGIPADCIVPSSEVIALIRAAPSLLLPSSTTDPTDPDSMALRVLSSSPEVPTPIMNNCPACCSVVRESAFARHLTVAGVGEADGDDSGGASDDGCRPRSPL